MWGGEGRGYLSLLAWANLPNPLCASVFQPVKWDHSIPNREDYYKDQLTYVQNTSYTCHQGGSGHCWFRPRPQHSQPGGNLDKDFVGTSRKISFAFSWQRLDLDQPREGVFSALVEGLGQPGSVVSTSLESEVGFSLQRRGLALDWGMGNNRVTQVSTTFEHSPLNP